MDPLKTFICYAHEDHEVVAALRKHLVVFEKRGLLEIWFDGKILPGENWDKSIKNRLEQAELVLMFISVDFINSEYIEKTELQAALQRHRDGQAVLIPVIVRSCHWAEYFEIGKFQALPKNARPILSAHFPFRDDAFHEVAEGIRLTAQDRLEQQTARRRAEAEALEKARQAAETALAAEKEAARQKAEAEKTEKLRHNRDEAAWKKTLAEVDAAEAPDDRIEIFNTYLEDHQNHREEAETAIHALEGEIGLARKLKEKREQAEAKRQAEAEKRRQAESEARNLPEMIFVEGGSFQMGSDDGRENEKPVHAVTVPDFYLGKYPVTFEEYDRFCAATKRDKPGDQGWGRSSRPVIHVGWDDARAYCEWLSKTSGQKFRLPTEAEWEYAARGGRRAQGQPYAGGSDPDAVAWHSGNSGSQTHPVGEKKANELGLHDMSGNVWEWCEDDWHGDYKNNPPADGSAWVDDPRRSHRVLRGGSWFDGPANGRAAYRFGSSRDFRFKSVGFRLARTP